jgi:hypothetical protein
MSLKHNYPEEVSNTNVNFQILKEVRSSNVRRRRSSC